MANKVSVIEDCAQKCTFATEINKYLEILDAGVAGRVTLSYDILNYITVSYLQAWSNVYFFNNQCVSFTAHLINKCQNTAQACLHDS